MRVENHKLRGDPNLWDLTERQAPGRVHLLVPQVICIHYDVCHSLAMNTGAQFASGLFYHVAVQGMDGDSDRGEVRQYAPFNRRGSHAKGHNNKAIGLVIVNPGPLVRGDDGQLRTTYGKLWPEDDAIEAKHWHPGAPKNWAHWAAYHHEERDAVLAVIAALLAAYPTIHTVCGHDELSPGRKFDPGPAAETAIMSYIRGAFPNINVPDKYARDDA